MAGEKIQGSITYDTKLNANRLHQQSVAKLSSGFKS